MKIKETHLERTHKGFIYTHHRTSVVKLAAVVGCREESDQLPLCKELITILHHLCFKKD